jgi:ribosomal protein L37AE/L43A
MEALIFLVGLWAALALIPAYVARSKGRSFGGFWLYGFILWPVAIIHAVIMKAERGSEHAEQWQNVNAYRQCPFCAETIRREAIVCKHCGRDIAPPSAAPAAVPVPSAAKDEEYRGVKYTLMPDLRVEVTMDGRTHSWPSLADFRRWVDEGVEKVRTAR